MWQDFMYTVIVLLLSLQCYSNFFFKLQAMENM
jgi:hypothetical protein